MPLRERDLNIPHVRKKLSNEKGRQSHSKIPRCISATPPTIPVNPKCTTSFKASLAAATDKPLPVQKPLPSRPIAHISTSLSPSKHSRGLIDAQEAPLRLRTADGETYDWPTLRPQSFGPRMDFDLDWANLANFDEGRQTSLSPSPGSTRASLLATAEKLGNGQTTTSLRESTTDLAKSLSLPSSYRTAQECIHSTIQDEEHNVSPVSPQNSIDENRDLAKCSLDIKRTTLAKPVEPRQPPRHSSLMGRKSFNNLLDEAAPSAIRKKSLRNSISVQDLPTTTAAIDSRQHSPSPASFSQPRPGSLSSVKSKTLKTASRLPIPDSKKATVVDVKKNRQSTSALPKPIVAFETRRAATPDALKVHEKGKIRRQLSRLPTEGSLPRLRTDATWDLESNASTAETPSLSFSFDTPSAGTATPNSPEAYPIGIDVDDMNEMTIDYDQNIRPAKRYSSTHKPATTVFDGRKNKVQDRPDDFILRINAPPSTSPFTLPLPTIASQSTLPTSTVRAPDEGLTEHARTLSRLEGQGSPQKNDVDRQKLQHLFGHLKGSSGRKARNSASIADSAAMAERYLARRSSVPQRSGTKAGGKNGDVGSSPTGTSRLASHNKIARKPVNVSKWSNSTPSDSATSPTAERISPRKSLIAARKRTSQTPSTRSSSAEATSIGFPSSIPALFDDVTTSSAMSPSIVQRRSSPTLGEGKKLPRKAGSARRMREGLKPTPVPNARSATPSVAKRNSRVPTPGTKMFARSDRSPRGRLSTPKDNMPSEGVETTAELSRSRSKSRCVLEKINGLFAGKKEQSSQDVPPVPNIKESKLKKDAIMKLGALDVSLLDSPYIRGSVAPQLPKFPGLSSSMQFPFGDFLETSAEKDNDTDSSNPRNSQSLQSLSEHIVGKARHEQNANRKARLLNFAKVLNDSLINAREAQISAETATHAAKSAQLSYEMTQKSLAMVQQLAAAVLCTGPYRKR